MGRGGTLGRCIKKKNSEKPAKRSKSENYCWTDLVFTSTAPPFGKGQLKLIRVQFCWWNEKKLVSLGGRRKEAQKVSLTAVGEPDFVRKGAEGSAGRCENHFSLPSPLTVNTEARGPRSLPSVTMAERLMQEDRSSLALFFRITLGLEHCLYSLTYIVSLAWCPFFIAHPFPSVLM